MKISQSIIVFACWITLVICCVTVIFVFSNLHPDSPIEIEFKVTEASITQFNLTIDNTLHYNFNFNITANNSNNDVQFYEKIYVSSYYKGNEFAAVATEPFLLGPKNTIMLKSVMFEGNSLIKLKPQQVIEYNNETQLGFYNLDLKLFPCAYCHGSKVHCRGLKVPLISNGKLESTFNVTKCSYD